MAEDTPDLEQKLQIWSVRGANIPWSIFTAMMLLLLVLAAIEDPDPSQFDYGMSISLLLLLSFGIIDRFRTSMYFRSAGILLLAFYGANLLITSSAVSWVVIGVCFSISALSLIHKEFSINRTDI